jgi:hypothetical protein
VDTQREFYDLVVRIRDDTYAFGKWVLSLEKYGGALTSARVNSFRGINDHNFVIDRLWADTLYRGFIEDYYFNSSLAEEVLRKLFACACVLIDVSVSNLFNTIGSRACSCDQCTME